MKKRIIVGITSASGAPVAVELLRQLKKNKEVETHLIYTKATNITFTEETGMTMQELDELADFVHDNENIAASISSGTYKTLGMIIVPCSMKTLAGVVSGYSDKLILRAADVVLKERRKLVLVPRECPFGTIHLRNMYELSQMGAVIIPPVLSFYNHPDSIYDCTRHIVGKILDQFDIESDAFDRWEGMNE